MKIIDSEVLYKQPFGWSLVCSLLLRLPLVFLPGAGRDEALYWYWAHHPEPAYSALLQFLVRLFVLLPLPEIWSLRGISLVAGILSLWLLNRILVMQQMETRPRFWLLMAVAFSPWQTYTGAILHPDSLLVFMLLLTVYLIKNRQFYAAAFTAGLSILAKPTGMLLAAIVLLFWLTDKQIAGKTRMKLMFTTLMFTIPVIVFAKAGMIQGIFEFGKIDPQVTRLHALTIQIFALVVFAGPALIVAAIKGVGDLRTIAQKLNTGSWQTFLTVGNFPVLVAAVFVGGFGAAIIFTGQMKANWMLPALVMLLLLRPDPGNLKWLKRGVYVSTALSLSLGVVFRFPALIEKIETALPAVSKSYVVQAGSREMRVSATAGWFHRLQEYQPLTTAADSILQVWQERMDTACPAWIISDDYGFAAQMLFEWQQPQIQLFITGDPLFKHRLPAKNSTELAKNGLILSVLTRADKGIAGLEYTGGPFEISHPYADGVIHCRFGKQRNTSIIK